MSFGASLYFSAARLVAGNRTVSSNKNAKQALSSPTNPTDEKIATFANANKEVFSAGMVEQTSITREKIIDQHPHVINESPGDRTYVESTDSIDDEFYDAGLSEKELKEKIKNPGSFDYGEYASQMNLENMDDTHQPLFAPVHEDKREQTNQLDKTGNLQSSNPGSPVVSGPKTESKGIPFNYHDSDDDE